MSTNYKDTLNLPQTQFPMKADLVKREPQRLAQWEAAGLYESIQAARADAELFVLHDGPPFANGDVHMGTALNKVLKDIIVKSRSMLGFRAPYIPGWDCHGLPIEFKVVKESRGLAPVEIRQKSEAYARKFIDIQRTQFKRLGVLGDWEHPYLTLDPGYEAEIIRAFAAFVEKGLVYQSKKPVYWSTGAQTALAEAEVEYTRADGPGGVCEFQLIGARSSGLAKRALLASARVRRTWSSGQLRLDVAGERGDRGESATNAMRCWTYGYSRKTRAALIGHRRGSVATSFSSEATGLIRSMRELGDKLTRRANSLALKRSILSWTAHRA